MKKNPKKPPKKTEKATLHIVFISADFYGVRNWMERIKQLMS